MKLTNYMRDAFILAAMNDVPKVDYDEQLRKTAQSVIEAKFAKAFPGIDYKAACESGWLERCGVRVPALGNIYTWAPGYNVLKDDPKVWAKLEELARKHDDQQAARKGLEDKLHAVAYACATRKALAEMLPEFTKYLPAEADKGGRSLPVVANVVTDFVKAGWPKGGKPKA